MGRLTKRINAELAKGLTYEAVIYKDIEHHETDFNYKALNKLAHYEDMEEQGRLIKLPCAVGSRVYFLLLNGEIDSQFIDNIQTALYFSDGNGNLKKGFYRTEEEAKRRLEELKGE